MRGPLRSFAAKGGAVASGAIDDCFLFEQAGRQFYMAENGRFVAAMSDADKATSSSITPRLRDEWDAELGDRMNKLVFIGQDMDRASIERALDDCLV